MMQKPNCPAGYTSLPQLGKSCFKVTSQKGVQAGAIVVDAKPSMQKMCAQDSTRLASFTTAAEMAILLQWAFGPEFTPTASDKTVCSFIITHAQSFSNKVY